MRTKTLLIAAAALAAGVISSQAQPVYSQNIVGYVNQPVIVGYTTFANPLDQANGNSVTNILTPGPWDGTLFAIWTGTSYAQYTIDSSFPTGVADGSDQFVRTAPTLDPGQAFFIDNLNSSNTLTVVGTVHVDGAGASTNVVGVTTNTIVTSPILTFVSSKLPIAGGLTSVLGLNADQAADGNVVSVPIINAAGNITGFNTLTIDSSFSSGYADGSDQFSRPEPVIPIGGGFFFDNLNGAPVNWVQSF